MTVSMCFCEVITLTNGHYLIPSHLINQSSKCKGSYLTTANHVLMHILKFKWNPLPTQSKGGSGEGNWIDSIIEIYDPCDNFSRCWLLLTLCKHTSWSRIAREITTSSYTCAMQSNSILSWCDLNVFNVQSKIDFNYNHTVLPTCHFKSTFHLVPNVT